MRRFLIPLLLFLTVLSVSLLCMPYSLLQLENRGLFLFTPDYFRETMTGTMPLATLLYDFITQFFQTKWGGAAITASAVLSIYLMPAHLGRRFGCPAVGLFATIVAGGGWYFSVKAGNGVMLAAVFLVVFILWLLSNLALAIFHGSCKSAFIKERAVFALSVAVVAVSALSIIIDGNLSQREKWNKVEYATMQRDWNTVIDETAPEEVAGNPEMLPFALLALSEKGALPYRIKNYPVKGEEDFDYGESISERAYFFGSILYDCMGCVPESVHRLWQAASYFPHDTSFGTLRQLVRLYAKSGDYGLAIKYCGILKRSVCHRRWAGRKIDEFRKKASAAGDPVAESNLSYGAPTITRSLKYNMFSLISAGCLNKAMSDRMLCLLLVERNIPGFRAFLEQYRDIYGGELPPLYQEYARP